MDNVPAAPSNNTNMTTDTAVSSASVMNQTGKAGDESGFIPKVDEALEERKKVHPVLAGFSKLTMSRQVGLMIGMSAAVALAMFVVLWSQEDTYSPLMNANNSYNTKDIINLLQAEKIGFSIDPVSGVILVKDSELHDARLAVAGADLSVDGAMGFELLDQEQALGTSQFMENARYRRSLEGELTRTISSINQIRSSRVHLAIPKRSVFVNDRRTPSASVFVELYPGGALEKDHVKAITNLVATSIEELSPDNVTIVDQRGRLLSDFDEDPEASQNDKQFEFTRKIEESMARRINSILEPIIGSDGFRAEVSADVDFTAVEQTEELFNPDLIALRSEQVLSEEKIGENVGGIPGALTNQPPGNAIAPEETGDGTGTPQQPPTTKRDEATRNYEVDRTLSYTVHQQGRVRRLTVAVVVDDLALVNADGEAIEQTWTQDELDRLRILVQDAVGFDASRGDSVNVINSRFMATEDVIEEPPFWTQPWFWEIAKQVLAGIFVLILIFGVFRPALKNLMDQGNEEETEDSLDLLDVDEDAISDDKVTLSGADEYSLPGASEGFERQLDAIRGLIAEDPGRVAIVFQDWIMTND